MNTLTQISAALPVATSAVVPEKNFDSFVHAQFTNEASQLTYLLCSAVSVSWLARQLNLLSMMCFS
jgi:hypothetical protein